MGKNFERERQLGLGIGYEGSFLATPFFEHSQPHLNVKDSRYLIVYHTTMGIASITPAGWPSGNWEDAGSESVRVGRYRDKHPRDLYLDPQSM